jgi:hypothetical protein
MPALGGSPTSHASTQFQFLGSVLSQRGPSALPYVEDDKWNIRQHLLQVIQEFPGLQVRLPSSPTVSSSSLCLAFFSVLGQRIRSLSGSLSLFLLWIPFA